MPRYDDSPAAPAKIVSASPDTIWFARSVIDEERVDRTPATAPANAATPIPAASDTVDPASTLCTAQNPMTAPIEHHPFDAEIEHAGALGEQLAERCVEERRSVQDARGDHDDERGCCSRCRLRGRRCRGSRAAVEADAVTHEQLAAERAEQDQSLHDADEPSREVGALQREAGVL